MPSSNSDINFQLQNSQMNFKNEFQILEIKRILKFYKISF